MSVEAILAAIEASGEAEIAQLRGETEARVSRILAEAERAASAKREAARRAALRPASGERARRLQQARLEALRALGEARSGLVEQVLAETRARLAHLRANAHYPLILRRLAAEVIGNLREDDAEGEPCQLEADPRDEALLRCILNDLGLDLAITSALDNWGGLAARSGDGKIVAINTLEARLERATPFLRRDLAAFFEKQELKEQEEFRETLAPSVS